MNTKLILTLAIAAAPVMAAPAITLLPDTTDQALTIAAEYTRIENGIDQTGYGATLKYDQVLAPMNNGNYWSWNASFNYCTGSTDNGNGVQDTDFNSQSIRLGIDANIVTNKNLTVFVGPRIGYNIFDVDMPNFDKVKSIMYGFSAGVRYRTARGTNWEAGYIHGWYNNTKDNIGMGQETHSITEVFPSLSNRRNS